MLPPFLFSALFVSLLTLQSASVVNPATLGPKVGQSVPDFTLPDQNGREHTLKSVTGPSGALILFYRSAEW